MAVAGLITAGVATGDLREIDSGHAAFLVLRAIEGVAVAIAADPGLPRVRMPRRWPTSCSAGWVDECRPPTACHDRADGRHCCLQHSRAGRAGDDGSAHPRSQRGSGWPVVADSHASSGAAERVCRIGVSAGGSGGGGTAAGRPVRRPPGGGRDGAGRVGAVGVVDLAGSGRPGRRVVGRRGRAGRHVGRRFAGLRIECRPVVADRPGRRLRRILRRLPGHCGQSLGGAGPAGRQRGGGRRGRRPIAGSAGRMSPAG